MYVYAKMKADVPWQASSDYNRNTRFKPCTNTNHRLMFYVFVFLCC